MSTATATMNPMEVATQGQAPNALEPARAGVPALAPSNANGAGANAGGAYGVPATSGPAGTLAQVREMMERPTIKRSLPALIILIAIVVFALVFSWMQAPQTRTLMPGLQGADLQEAFDSLKNAGYSPELDTISGQLRIDQKRFHEARIFLAGQGIPREPVSGLNALNEQNAMTTSQFMEQARYNAAIEQELARSIGQIAGIQHARVHLATPKQSVFVRDRTPPKASVVLNRHPGRTISEQQIQAIVHLISSSIPYMLPESVTVVDNFGNLLTRTVENNPLGLTSAQAELKRTQEELLRSRVMELLSPVVGAANVRSQVNLTLDFTQVENTTEDYDRGGNGPRTRSEVIAEDRDVSLNAAGVPGALANQPPGAGVLTPNTEVTAGEGGTSNTRSSRTTRNYELDRVVQHIKAAQGGVKRLTVAVVINERPVFVAEDAPVDPAAPKSIPYTEQELDRMLNLVRGAVGYDEARGDIVTIMPARFEPPEVLEPMVPWYQDDMVLTSFKQGLMALVLVTFLLFIVRPVIRNLLGESPEQLAEKEAAKALPDGELSEEDMNMIQLGEGETLEEIKAKLRPKKSSISADMLDTANTYDDKVALIRMLVAEDSGRVANVLRRMIRVDG